MSGENGQLRINTLMINTGLTDKDLDQEIVEKDLSKIADLFDSVDGLCEQFGLSRAERNDVVTQRILKGTKESAKQALEIWINRYPSEATFKNLLIILLDSTKGVVAKDVANYISNGPQQEPTNDHTGLADKEVNQEIAEVVHKKGVVAKDVADYTNRPQQEPTNNQPRPEERKERQGYYQYLMSAVMVAILAIGVGILVLALYNKVPSLILKMSEPPKENGQLTIDTLMINTGLTYMQEQVNQEIAETDLPKIAVLFVADNRFIDDLCEQFGLLPAEKEDVRRLRDFETTDKSLKKALEIWRNRYPYKATFKNLLIILLDNEFLKGVVAKDVANYISNRSQKEPTNNQPRPEERQGYYQYFISAVVVIQAIGMGLLVKKLYNKHSLIYTTLTMTNFKKYKANKTVWFSPPVYTHHRGYKICLRVEANGWGDGKGSHVSVFVHFMRGEFDDSLKWPFRGAISYQLMDQVNGEDHKTYTRTYDDKTPNKNSTRVTEGDRAANGWGNSKFIAHTELEPKYLRNNILIFQITNVELKWLLKE